MPELPALFPKMSDTTKNIRNTTKRIFAIPAAPAAIPPKPNTAAIMAIIKNVTDQRNILYDFKLTEKC
jgi:hypothetical protein